MSFADIEAAKKRASAMDPSLRIIDGEWIVEIEGVELRALALSQPFTLLAPRLRPLVRPVADEFELGGYRYGVPVLRASCRIRLGNMPEEATWPVELGVIAGADVWLGYDLMVRASLI